MSGGQHLTHNELVAELNRVEIKTDSNKAAHFLLQAELDGIICNGATKGKQTTYALLKERIPEKQTYNRDEALAKLANRYFTSHCPATLQDFVWWSGLLITDARNALEAIAPQLLSEEINSETYWFTNTNSIPGNNSCYLLPAFDEFIISYKSRNVSLPRGVNNKAIANNGIFRPVVVVNGQVAGIWKRTVKKNRVLIEVDLFHQPTKADRNLINMAADRFGDLVGLKAETKIHP